MAETYLIDGVEALWPRVDRTYAFNSKIRRSEPCDARDQGASYSIQFRMDEPTAKALLTAMRSVYDDNRDDGWDERLSNPFVKDDDGTYTHKASLKGAYNGETTVKPLEVDSNSTPLPEGFQLTTGSTVNVAVNFIPYRMKRGKEWECGVSLRLKAVQVVKYVPKEVRNPFKAVDGGFVLDDNNPFAKAAASTKSNNVLADGADEDEEDTPPKKMTGKAKGSDKPSDSVDSLVEKWDD